jgi:PAS domain S-box-containing protein
MNETAVQTSATAGNPLAGAPPAISRPFLPVAAVVVLELALLVWLCHPSRWSHGESKGGSGRAQSTQTPAEPLGWQVVGTAAASGAAVLVTVLLGLTTWQRAWQRHVQATEVHWHSQVARLEYQMTEYQKLKEVMQEAEAKLRTKVAELDQDKTRLQAELDQRKRNEHSLSRQRQDLESSKTVLELHVQARTQEVQALKHRYEMILNSAGEGICGLDLEGRITFLNPAVEQMLGRAQEELLGKKAREILCPGGAAAAAELDSGEQMFGRKDGSRFPAEVVRSPIAEHGRQIGAVLIFRDVTERRRAEETLAQKAAELTRSNAELEQFAFVASHDLQEPLRKIQAFGDRLKTKCEGLLPADALDYLQRMQSASARMRTLIDDLLAFSRVIRNSAPFEPVDLTRIAREVLGDLEMRLEKSGGQVDIGALPAVEADPTQMRQLLLNLIGNALKFQPPGGRPLVKVQGRTFASGSGEEYCELTVQDNGIGFEEQYAEKIFAVFQRLHGRGEYEGTGVGLAVCRRITDRHQGTVIAHGQPGKGATFIVTLPVRQHQPQKPETAAA